MRAEHRPGAGGLAPSVLLLVSGEGALGGKVCAVAEPADVADAEVPVVHVLLRVLCHEPSVSMLSATAHAALTLAWLGHPRQRQPCRVSSAVCSRQ
jgi:hypothetical protein